MRCEYWVPLSTNVTGADASPRIMFFREFKVIDSAYTIEQLRMRLKSEELEQYGEPFTPEFVYEAIRKLSRFASMRVSCLFVSDDFR